jgi:hypothetical protein
MEQHLVRLDAVRAWPVAQVVLRAEQGDAARPHRRSEVQRAGVGGDDDVALLHHAGEPEQPELLAVDRARARGFGEHRGGEFGFAGAEADQHRDAALVECLRELGEVRHRPALERRERRRARMQEHAWAGQTGEQFGRWCWHGQHGRRRHTGETDRGQQPVADVGAVRDRRRHRHGEVVGTFGTFPSSGRVGADLGGGAQTAHVQHALLDAVHVEHDVVALPPQAPQAARDRRPALAWVDVHPVELRVADEQRRKRSSTRKSTTTSGRSRFKAATVSSANSTSPSADSRITSTRPPGGR